MGKLNSKPIRYLLAGAWNTLFGYGVMGGLFNYLSPYLNLVTIGIIANLLSISMSFSTYKLFVFCTKGNWFKEYLKSYIVYGGAACFNILLIWILVAKMGVNIWLAQAIAIPLGVMASYFGHHYLTFKASPHK